MPEWLNILLRSFVLVIILFFLTKAVRKKHLSQLSIFDYMNGIVAGGIVAITTTRVENFLYGLIALFTWFAVPFLVDFLALKSKTIRDYTEGKSTVIIQDGKIMEENLKKTSFSADDLLQHLRGKDYFHVSDVEFALLEPTGKISVLPKTDKQPLTASDLHITLTPTKESQTVIMDGKILLEPLANLNLNPSWLQNELDKQNVTIENVFLAQADSHGQLFIDLYDDQLSVPTPTEKPLLLANLKKAQADLELFALATENKQSQSVYWQNSEKLQKAIDLVEPHLRN